MWDPLSAVGGPRPRALTASPVAKESWGSEEMSPCPRSCEEAGCFRRSPSGEPGFWELQLRLAGAPLPEKEDGQGWRSRKRTGLYQAKALGREL